MRRFCSGIRGMLLYSGGCWSRLIVDVLTMSSRKIWRQNFLYISPRTSLQSPHEEKTNKLPYTEDTQIDQPLSSARTCANIQLDRLHSRSPEAINPCRMTSTKPKLREFPLKYFSTISVRLLFFTAENEIPRKTLWSWLEMRAF